MKSEGNIQFRKQWRLKERMQKGTREIIREVIILKNNPVQRGGGIKPEQIYSSSEPSSSSAFMSHSMNLLICSKKMLLPFEEWSFLYQRTITSSERTSSREKRISLWKRKTSLVKIHTFIEEQYDFLKSFQKVHILITEILNPNEKGKFSAGSFAEFFK